MALAGPKHALSWPCKRLGPGPEAVLSAESGAIIQLREGGGINVQGRYNNTQTSSFCRGAVTLLEGVSAMHAGGRRDEDTCWMGAEGRVLYPKHVNLRNTPTSPPTLPQEIPTDVACAQGRHALVFYRPYVYTNGKLHQGTGASDSTSGVHATSLKHAGSPLVHGIAGVGGGHAVGPRDELRRWPRRNGGGALSAKGARAQGGWAAGRMLWTPSDTDVAVSCLCPGSGVPRGTHDTLYKDTQRDLKRCRFANAHTPPPPASSCPGDAYLLPLKSPPFCQAGSPPRGGGGGHKVTVPPLKGWGGTAPQICTIVPQCKSASAPCKNYLWRLRRLVFPMLSGPR